MRVRYESNNSGGYWWLTREDWTNLKKFEWAVDISNHSAEKEFQSIKDAIIDFEHITGQNADDEGCVCCGPPHYFYKVSKK